MSTMQTYTKPVPFNIDHAHKYGELTCVKLENKNENPHKARYHHLQQPIQEYAATINTHNPKLQRHLPPNLPTKLSTY